MPVRSVNQAFLLLLISMKADVNAEVALYYDCARLVEIGLFPLLFFQKKVTVVGLWFTVLYYNVSGCVFRYTVFIIIIVVIGN